MKKTRLFQNLFTVAVVILSVLYVYLNQELMVVLLTLAPARVLVVVLILFVFFLASGFTFYLLVRLVCVRLTIIEFFGLTFVTTLGNYLGPARPGAAIKAVYLKGQKQLSYARFSAVLAANGFLMFLVSGAVGLIVLSIFWLQTRVFPIELVIVCLMLTGVALLPFVVRLSSVKRSGRIWNTINNALEGFGIIRSQPLGLLAVCGSLLLQYVISALVMMVTYHTVGHEISFTIAFLIGVFTSISNFFTLTPNNLGVQEVVMAYLYTLSGMDFSSGLIGAGFIRAVHLLITFGIGPIFIYLMLRRSELTLEAVMPHRSGT